MNTDDEKPFELTEPEFEPDDEGLFENDVAELLTAILALLNDEITTTPMLERLSSAIEKVEAWYQDDDPRSMGWVDDKGRP